MGGIGVQKVNCRRVNSLLSAYLDAELTGVEMLEIRAHTDACASCRAEIESLRATKRLLSSLRSRVPRQEFEALLCSEAERASHPLYRFQSSWLLAWREGVVVFPRSRPLAATAALSLAGLLLATASLETPRERAPRAALSEMTAAYPASAFVYPTSSPPPSVDIASLRAEFGSSARLQAFGTGGMSANHENFWLAKATNFKLASY